MRVVCSYCEILYDLKEPFDDDSVSHGICPECLPWVKQTIETELKEISERELLGPEK